ncbi:hypothetical protein T4B_3691 [Trichinella pseudospiralis]|uniref:Uncharacterized protein n=1 Tax=Trichinella pseudospiralis TaxID=6337 RepID=A0A0V1GFC9_TRIPS|nr:hypothetical protein T4B_3691 [Trichinella pseudospiralis]
MSPMLSSRFPVLRFNLYPAQCNLTVFPTNDVLKRYW